MNLKELIRPSLVAIDVDVKDWQEAIKSCGNLLNKDGATEDRYTEAMIHVAKEFGPYIVVAPGIALPHARPEDGVLRTSMAVAKLKTAVYFGNKDNDPVWLLVALAAVDHQQHIQGLAELASVLGNSENVNKIKRSKTTRELLKVFHSASTTD
jgi:mannitol/fructose-specific phosphotransferase system IIA component (Ntr-type)